jgi:hypothetical protein
VVRFPTYRLLAPLGAALACALAAPAAGGAAAPNVGGCEVFPASTAPPGSPSAPDQSAWNQDVSRSPVRHGSRHIVRQINADGPGFLHPDFGSNPDYGIPYAVVPPGQPDVPVLIGPAGFPDESDFGPAPIPPDAPVEAGSDHHALVVQQGTCGLFELYRAQYLGGAQQRWQADATAFFDLGAAGPLRFGGDYATSADAAGLPILPGLVRYDEVAGGSVDHAIRVTFGETRRAFVHPATHYASSSCNRRRPAMGMRLRLRPGYDISGLDGEARAIARALKTYGMLVADNGTNWYITGATDPRWNDAELNELKAIPGRAFQVLRSAARTRTPC